MVPSQAFLNINEKLQVTIKRQNMNPDKLLVKVIIYIPTATIFFWFFETTNFNEGMNSALQEKGFVMTSDEIKLKVGLYSRLWTFIVISKIWILNVLFKIGLLPSWQDYYKNSCNCITILGNSDDMKDNKRFFKLLPWSSEILSCMHWKHDWVSSWKSAL